MPKLKWTRHEDLAIERGCSVRREDYLDHMTFTRNIGPMFTEIFGPIIGLKEEWETQGARPDELTMARFRYRCPMTGGVPVSTGYAGPATREVIEDNDEHLLYRDGLGRVMELAKGVSTLPLPTTWPVRTMDDWLKVKPWYAFNEARLAGAWETAAREHHAAGRAVVVHMPGGYDTPRQLMGDENACLAFIEQPELIADMMATLGDTAMRVLDQVSRAVAVDVLSVHEDMAGRSGPMIGPDLFRPFITPYYRRVWDMLAERGARLFDVDSDGDIRPILDAMLEGGVNCIHPVEPAAGMDVLEIRARYGKRLAFYGGIDKHVLRKTTTDIDAELRRVLPSMVASGGCVLGLDHRIPNGTPLAHYRYYVARAWEIMEQAARALRSSP